MDLDIRQNSMDWSWIASRELGYQMDSAFLDLDSRPVPDLVLSLSGTLLTME
jgi:hypothetical protein